jgi:FdhD protein
MIDRALVDSPNGTTVLNWSEEGGWENSPGKVGDEMALALYVDQVELATMMCTPEKLNFLIAGFLRSEGLIETLNDIALMRVCDEEQVADVRLMRPREMGGRRILTSGCGGGVTFDEGSSVSPVTSDLRVAPPKVLARMREMLKSFGGRAEQGGTHVSALSDGESLLAVARDVGRHNTLDKIWGQCLFQEILTAGKILLTTGRLSSEMVVKSAKMGVPVAVSLNSPTSRAVELGRQLGITLVGYARGSRLSVYTHPERLQVPAESL